MTKILDAIIFNSLIFYSLVLRVATSTSQVIIIISECRKYTFCTLTFLLKAKLPFAQSSKDEEWFL